MPKQDINLMMPPASEMAFDQAAIRLHQLDDVAIARVTLPAGQVITDAGNPLALTQLTPSGHKLALHDIAAGSPIRRYGQVIGFASAPIRPGDHVHTHNVSVQEFTRDYAFGADVYPVDFVPTAERRTFMGFKRANGRVGTRNMIAVISSVNCSAHTCRQIARHFTPERLSAWPNVDGVIALTHGSGCATQVGGPDYVLLQRTLAGMAANPNVGAYIIVGLGCEANQISDLIRNQNMGAPFNLTIQDNGGIRQTVQAGIEAVERLLPLANATARTPQPISELMLALQCGGSDGWSGVTANPLLGMMVDELVRQGGSGVLAETPEIYGAEHLLTRRAINQQVGERLIERVHWWERHCKRIGAEIDNNPSPGNKAGGLTTIYEKSLGAVAKGGTTPLMGVYEYAEPVTARGFTFMDSPGYDPVSVTGQVAGGCNLVLFTTGRGSVFGFKPAPSIKIVTNTPTYERMRDDMDVDAGRILAGVPMAQAAADLLDLVIAVASGQPSKSEAQDVGEEEFNPWNLGGVL
ncbi:MAG TPA: altronate dehydratase family protein [Anaerolineae bacterium]